MRHVIRTILTATAVVGAFSPTAGQDSYAVMEPRGVSWTPIVEMQQDLFPSLAIATATLRTWGNQPRMVQYPTYVGDAIGALGATVETVGLQPGSRLKLEVSGEPFFTASVIEAVVSRPGAALELFPEIHYAWSSLEAVRHPTPATARFRLFVDGELLGDSTRTIRIRSANDVPISAVHRSGQVQDYAWMFAAFVNENHPAVDEILSEALRLKTTNAFLGYQGTQSDVHQQVYAIWNVLQRRGIKYSSITTPSGMVEGVLSQHVRTFGESLESAQANCVDGSVLFASILRKIGIEPFLVLIPGHMMVGFYLNAEHSERAVLETTMLGNTDLATFSEDASLGGALSVLLGADTRNQASHKSYLQAISAGAERFNRVRQLFGQGNAQFQVIEIAAVRQVGINPLNR